eukprot:Amastigsp_a220_54.p2 type:complete len:114 gc:universal Amastigsp_a220_54:52-393(+)
MQGSASTDLEALLSAAVGLLFSQEEDSTAALTMMLYQYSPSEIKQAHPLLREAKRKPEEPLTSGHDVAAKRQRLEELPTESGAKRTAAEAEVDYSPEDHEGSTKKHKALDGPG